MPASGLWRAVIPELGIELHARELRQLQEKLRPYVERLPRAPEVQRINGYEHDPLPASRNLLPKR